MKKLFVIAAVTIMGFTACNDDSKTNTNTTTTTDTATTNNTMANDGTTTTTTTTTTVVTTRSLENRNLMVVKTNKPIQLKYDPDHSYYIDATTNKQATTYFYDPATNDTFDYRGYIVNNALLNNNGDWKTDESRLWSNQYNVTLRDSIQAGGSVKIKQNDNSYKEKTDSTKLKVTDNKMKVKSK
ncbi:hypothetical protein BH09BAC2_BH09BAC2_21730 [soil metagenome]